MPAHPPRPRTQRVDKLCSIVEKERQQWQDRLQADVAAAQQAAAELERLVTAAAAAASGTKALTSGANDAPHV